MAGSFAAPISGWKYFVISLSQPSLYVLDYRNHCESAHKAALFSFYCVSTDTVSVALNLIMNYWSVSWLIQLWLPSHSSQLTHKEPMHVYCRCAFKTDREIVFVCQRESIGGGFYTTGSIIQWNIIESYRKTWNWNYSTVLSLFSVTHLMLHLYMLHMWPDYL